MMPRIAAGGEVALDDGALRRPALLPQPACGVDLSGLRCLLLHLALRRCGSCLVRRGHTLAGQRFDRVREAAPADEDLEVDGTAAAGVAAATEKHRLAGIDREA